MISIVINIVWLELVAVAAVVVGGWLMLGGITGNPKILDLAAILHHGCVGTCYYARGFLRARTICSSKSAIPTYLIICEAHSSTTLGETLPLARTPGSNSGGGGRSSGCSNPAGTLPLRTFRLEGGRPTPPGAHGTTGKEGLAVLHGGRARQTVAWRGSVGNRWGWNGGLFSL